jgi:hypothetical protein
MRMKSSIKLVIKQVGGNLLSAISFKDQLQIQLQNYHYGIESLFFLTVDIAGHVLLLRFVTLLPTTFYSTSSIL